MPLDETRIAVWVPYTPDRPLVLVAADEVRVLNDPDAQLYREAFVWQVREDIWAGLEDAERRQALSGRLMDDFAPALPPAKRDMRKLCELLKDIATSFPLTAWSDSGQVTEEDGETPYRLNSTLAFYLQMMWIYDVFKDTPSASVSVR